MRTNVERLVTISVMGEVSHPRVKIPTLDGDGGVHYVPGIGGIAYDFTLGDNAFKPFGDHIEPDVSTKNRNKDDNTAYMALSCVGNEAIVVSGDAKGMRGFVIGKHGGADHVLIHFPDLEKLSIGDKVLVRARGQGLKLLDFPDVKIYNLDPELFSKVFREEKGKIRIRVCAVIPPSMMGSGVGASDPVRGDYDINTSDEELVRELGLDSLRIGDFVAVEDHDSSHGLGGYRRGYLTIGVIVHSNCFMTGHGPGLTVIATGPSENFNVEIGDGCNLEDCM